MKSLVRVIQQCLALVTIAIAISGCFKETFLDIKADFTVTYQNENKAVPVKVTLNNISEGAESYKWTFEGADITSSSDRNPPTLTFTKKGAYKVTLEVKNLDGKVDTKVQEISVGDAIKPAFELVYDINNLAPAKITFKNKSQGATRYEWTFEKADKATSTDESPVVTFANEGRYKVSLKAFNGQTYISLDSTISIGAALSPNFEYAPLDFNVNYEAPLQLKISNTSRGSTSITWSIADASASLKSTKDSSTVLTLNDAKQYTLTMTATNGKQTMSTQKTITVNVPTNLLYWQDIKLGMNDNAAFPNYFVSRRNLAIPSNTLDTLTFGKEVDLVFFSRDSDFSYCRFVSPDQTSPLVMPSIPNAQKTSYVNLLESCEGCSNVTDAIFNNIKSAKDITALTFRYGTGVIEGFDDSKTPRYIPFRTYDGRVGILKIKNFVTQGNNSYVLVDIKVMRKP